MDIDAMWREMWRMRELESRIAAEYEQQQMRCPVHLATGAEGIAVGVCSQLRTRDHVYSNHRAHHHYLAKGGDMRELVAELHGRPDGCTCGYGGSMHLTAPHVGFMGTSPILAAQVPVAVGDAWAAKLDGDDRRVVVFAGDGATEEGVFVEAVNFASTHRLPILFVVEDNGLSVDTCKSPRRPCWWQPKHAGPIAVIETTCRRPEGVAKYARECLQRLPVVLWCRTVRVHEHVGPNVDREDYEWDTMDTHVWRPIAQQEVDDVWREDSE